MNRDRAPDERESVWKIILRRNVEWGMLVSGGVALAFIVERMSGVPIGAYLNILMSD